MNPESLQVAAQLMLAMISWNTADAEFPPHWTLSSTSFPITHIETLTMDWWSFNWLEWELAFQNCLHSSDWLIIVIIRKGVKQNFFLEIFPKCVFPPTDPRVFVRFGNTKGEFLFVQNLWFLLGKLCPHPPMFGRNLPKKKHEKYNNQPAIKTIFFGMLLREAPKKHSGFIWELLNAFDKFHPKN